MAHRVVSYRAPGERSISIYRLIRSWIGWCAYLPIVIPVVGFTVAGGVSVIPRQSFHQQRNVLLACFCLEGIHEEGEEEKIMLINDNDGNGSGLMLLNPLTCMALSPIQPIFTRTDLEDGDVLSDVLLDLHLQLVQGHHTRLNLAERHQFVQDLAGSVDCFRNIGSELHHLVVQFVLVVNSCTSQVM